MNKQQATAMLDCSMDSNLNFSTSKANLVYTPLEQQTKSNSAWGFWHGIYYPEVIKQSYPVYIQERAQDKGKQAFEIIKAMQDQKLIKLDKVSDFVDAMDLLIKIL